jgi:integrase
VLREELHILLPDRCDGLYLLRHTSGSWVYESAGPEEAQVALGHANITTTLGIYRHLAEGAGDETTDRVFARPLAPALAPEFTN